MLYRDLSGTTLGVAHNRQPPQHVREKYCVVRRVLGNPESNDIDLARDVRQQPDSRLYPQPAGSGTKKNQD